MNRPDLAGELRRASPALARRTRRPATGTPVRAPARAPDGIWVPVVAVAVLAAAVRLPFVGVGLVPDEGGYAYVASAWADGARLYHEAWVDRPQGLVLFYRLLLGLHDGPLAIRLGGLAAGVAVTVLVFLVGRLAHSRAAGLWAAGIYAVVAVAPRLEGYTLHSELAASVPATAAIAVALWWRHRPRAALLVLAGILGGAGVLMKQSGFDGLVVALAVAIGGAGAAGAAVRRVTLVAAGAAGALGAAALHGALLGWDAYWNAIGGYRLGHPSPEQRLEDLAQSLDLAALELLPVAVVAAVGAFRCARTSLGVPLLWLAAAFAGFHVGGSYWPHYYVQLVAPLSLLAGVAVAGLSRPALKVAAAAVATAPVTALFVSLVVAGPEERAGAIPSRPPADRDERVAHYLRDQTRPDERIYVLVSRANVYFLARRRAATPYLWYPPLAWIPGTMRELERTLSGPRAPAFIVVYQPAARVDASGRLERVIAARYVRDRGAPRGLPPILVRRDR